ncbi:MAG: DUF5331 domain-containing protein [Cyanobacteria bacterium P01_H01_bin.119]
MNTEELRLALKLAWLEYYRDNRDWLTRLGVWVTYKGKRRPSSSFILAALSTLEPQLTQLLPLIVDLSSNPDRIVSALGLNFNPDDELKAVAQSKKMLPSSTAQAVDYQAVDYAAESSKSPVSPDEACTGIGDTGGARV